MRPLVSICVPIYCVEKYIERCVVSLMEQTYDNIEYIFVNDCTPDKSIDILQKIVKRYPAKKNNVHIINHEKNRGLAAARNTAVNNCEGEFLLWVDSDDYIDTKTVENLVNKQKEKNSDIVNYGIIVYHSNYNEYFKNPIFDNPGKLSIEILKRTVPVCACGRLIRVSLYRDNSINVKEGLNMGEDYQVTPRLAYLAKNVDTLREYLYHYDCTNESSYTASFSEDKSLQVWNALAMLYDYFRDKGSEFTDAINEAKIRYSIRDIINCCKAGGHNEYFEQIKKNLKKINRKYWKRISFSNRIVLYIDNRSILTVYVKIAGFFKHSAQSLMTIINRLIIF